MSAGPRRRGALVVAAAVAVAGLLAGCGVPQDDQPRDIAAQDLPADFRGASGEAANESTRDSPKVFLVGADPRTSQPVLEESYRRGPRNATNALRELLKTPTREELDKGWNTVIPAATRLINIEGLSQPNGVLTIDLSKEFKNLAGRTQVQAFAQLVFTATEFGYRGVLIQVNGETLQALTAAGTSKAEPLTRADYLDLAPTTTTTTTTTTATATTTTSSSTTAAPSRASTAAASRVTAVRES